MILVVIEQEDGAPDRLSSEALTLGRSLAEAAGRPLHAVAWGAGAGDVAGALAGTGVAVLHTIDDARLTDHAPEAIGKALAQMHRRPSHDWSLEELAREVGLSRSVLAERFAGIVGVPPMQYLAKWRMQIASGLLAEGRANVATIANEIGYDSEASFSRAFKKMVGVPPSVWRRQRAHAA